MADPVGPEGADFYKVEASFARMDAATKEAIDILDAQLAEMVAQGDEVRRQSVIAQRKALLGGGSEITQTPELEQANKALREGAALRKRNLELDLADLDALKAQARVERLQTERLNPNLAAENRARLEAAGLVAPGTPVGRGPITIAPGGYTRSERIATGLGTEQTRFLAQIEAEVAARGRALAVSEVQATVDQAKLVHEAALVELIEKETAARDRELAASRAFLDAQVTAWTAGAASGAGGRLLPGGTRQDLTKGYDGERAALIELNAAQGEYAAFAERSGVATSAEAAALRSVGVAEIEASASTEALSASMLRLGIANAEASNSLRKHGALTTEFLGALARGETTVAEFGYQIGATIGKFAGWTAAAGATYAALGAVYEFGKGAIDAASAVQQLTRTIPNLDRNKASAALQGLSADVNVPINEAGDAVFAFSRTFHDLADATYAAKLALSAFKLDGVAVTDTVRAATAIHQQYGYSAQQLGPIFDELAQGQQKFNARMSDQIPILLKALPAIKNAGGGLREFIELSTIALRTTNLSGSQLSTGFSRSAANFLSSTTTKGQANRADLRSLGIDTNVGYNQILVQAIKRGPELTGPDRARLSQDIFGPLRGGLIQGLFGGGGAKLLPDVARQLSPTGAKDVLQVELEKQLHTAKEEFKSLGNELQRVGAALNGTGIITVFTALVGGFVTVADAARTVITAFDGLPQAFKDVVEGALAFRAAQLIISRTRFGSTFPGLNQIPGFRPSAATQARATLAIGNREVINQLGDVTARSTAGATVARREALILGPEQAAAQARVKAAETAQARGAADDVKLKEATAAATADSNVISAKIAQLEQEAASLERRAAAAQALRVDALAKQAGYTATSRRLRAPDSSVLADAALAETGIDSAAGSAAADKSMTLSAFATQQATKAKLALSASGKALTGTIRGGAAAEADYAVFTREGAAAARVEAAATRTAEAANITAAEAFTSAKAAVGGLAASAWGMVSALDPLVLGLLVLPAIYGSITDSVKKQADAMKQAAHAANAPLQSIQDFRTAAENARHIAERLGHQARPSNVVQRTGTGLNDLFDIFTGNPLNAPTLVQGARAQQSSVQARAYLELGNMERYLADGFKKEADALVGTAAGRAELRHQTAYLRTRMEQLAYELPSAQSLPVPEVIKAYTGFGTILDRLYSAAQQRLKIKVDSGQNPFQILEQKSVADLEAAIVQLDDRSKVFSGTAVHAALQRAIYTYTYLAGRVGGNLNASSKDLQQLESAHQSLITVSQQGVTNLLAQAASAPTEQAQTADIAQARRLVDFELTTEKQALAKFIAVYKGHKDLIRAAQQATAQENAIILTQLTPVLTASIAQNDATTALQVSQVTGTSPESGIAKAQLTLAGLRKDLALAQNTPHPDHTKIQALQTAINDAANNLSQLQLANANGIADAQGALALARITGTTPQADIARARQALANARSKLARDQASHAGLAATLSDQAAVDQAAAALTQQIATSDTALAQIVNDTITAKADLAASQTTDPVKQAQIQLNADLQHAATIQRKNYTTEAAFLNAQREAKATTNKDRANLTAAYVSQQDATIQFELSTQQIGDQQAISGLQRLLKIKKLSLATQQQLRSEIYQIENGTHDLNLNVGNIKLPSVYQVRRALGLGQQGVLPGVPSTVITSNSTVNVYVRNKGDAATVGAVIDKHLHTTVKAAMRAKGAI